MSEQQTGPAGDAELVRALCAEARSLASGLRGPVSRVRVQAGDHAVEVEWEVAGAVPAATAAPGTAASGVAGSAASQETGEPSVPDEERHPVLAPLLGTYYRSPEPGAKPFVEEGDVVEAGQDVAIVEAMKIMNRVQADRAGRVVTILAADGEMVEFGQELMLLEPLDGGV